MPPLLLSLCHLHSQESGYEALSLCIVRRRTSCEAVSARRCGRYANANDMINKHIVYGSVQHMFYCSILMSSSSSSSSSFSSSLSLSAYTYACLYMCVVVQQWVCTLFEKVCPSVWRDWEKQERQYLVVFVCAMIERSWTASPCKKMHNSLQFMRLSISNSYSLSTTTCFIKAMPWSCFPSLCLPSRQSMTCWRTYVTTPRLHLRYQAMQLYKVMQITRNNFVFKERQI